MPVIQAIGALHGEGHVQLLTDDGRQDDSEANEHQDAAADEQQLRRERSTASHAVPTRVTTSIVRVKEDQRTASDGRGQCHQKQHDGQHTRASTGGSEIAGRT